MLCHWGVVEKLGLSYLPTVWYRYFRRFLISICILYILTQDESGWLFTEYFPESPGTPFVYRTNLCTGVSPWGSRGGSTTAGAELYGYPHHTRSPLYRTGNKQAIKQLTASTTQSRLQYHHRGSHLACGRGFLFFFSSFSLFFSFFFPIASSTNCRQRNRSSSNACPRRLRAVS